MTTFAEIMNIPALASATVLKCLEEAAMKVETSMLAEGMDPAEVRRLLLSARPIFERWARAKTSELVQRLLAAVDPEDLDAAALEALRRSGRLVTHPTNTWWKV